MCYTSGSVELSNMKRFQEQYKTLFIIISLYYSDFNLINSLRSFSFRNVKNKEKKEKIATIYE